MAMSMHSSVLVKFACGESLFYLKFCELNFAARYEIFIQYVNTSKAISFDMKMCVSL